MSCAWAAVFWQASCSRCTSRICRSTSSTSGAALGGVLPLGAGGRVEVTSIWKFMLRCALGSRFEDCHLSTIVNGKRVEGKYLFVSRRFVEKKREPPAG